MSAPDWNAEVYHRVAEPQLRWGLAVLEQLPLRGDETVLDAGCGTGRLTGALLERLPRGRVIALDVSEAMLAKATEHLADPRVTFSRADLAHLALDQVADVAFSAATFHWVLDHDALFEGLYRALRPGGRLHAQCGGQGNLARHRELARRELPPGASAEVPAFFAGTEDSLARLAAAGFSSPQAWLTSAPTSFPDAGSFRTFVEHVTLRTMVAPLSADEAQRFLDRVTKASEPDYSLDYVRLELRGTRR